MASPRASITLSRNGLTISVSVPVSKTQESCQHLLDIARELVKAGYKELIPDISPIHSGAFGEVNMDDIYEEGDRRRIGFHRKEGK